MEETVHQLMVSKFGRVIDLEALQTLSVNTTLEELKIKKLRKELTNAKEMKMWEVRLRGQVTHLGQMWVKARNAVGGSCKASVQPETSLWAPLGSPTILSLSRHPGHSLN